MLQQNKNFTTFHDQGKDTFILLRFEILLSEKNKLVCILKNLFKGILSGTSCVMENILKHVTDRDKCEINPVSQCRLHHITLAGFGRTALKTPIILY